MRSMKPLHLAAAVAIALSGSTVFAQTTGGTLRIAPGTSSASTTTGTTSTNGTRAAQTGGCVGTGGSSCTATSSSGTTTGPASGTTTSTTNAPGVQSEPNTFGSTLNPTPTPGGASGGSAMGTNQTTVDPAATRPGSFAPGGAFGPSGNTASTTGGVGNATVGGTNNTAGTNFLPGTTGAVVLPTDTPQTANQQNVVIQTPQNAASARVATPIFDEVAREGRAKERQRRARGDEPRIIGIAPRTDVDRTYQMPDDPIIRY
jgi:hypothetical protein